MILLGPDIAGIPHVFVGGPVEKRRLGTGLLVHGVIGVHGFSFCRTCVSQMTRQGVPFRARSPRGCGSLQPPTRSASTAACAAGKPTLRGVVPTSMTGRRYHTAQRGDRRGTGTRNAASTPRTDHLSRGRPPRAAPSTARGATWCLGTGAAITGRNVKRQSAPRIRDIRGGHRGLDVLPLRDRRGSNRLSQVGAS